MKRGSRVRPRVVMTRDRAAINSKAFPPHPAKLLLRRAAIGSSPLRLSGATKILERDSAEMNLLLMSTVKFGRILSTTGSKI